MSTVLLFCVFFCSLYVWPCPFSSRSKDSGKVGNHGRNNSENQKQIFNKIKRLKKKGLGYRRIAQYLNSKNIKAACGNEFKNNNVHSMLKKGLIRHNRLKQKPKIEIYDVSINYPIWL